MLKIFRKNQFLRSILLLPVALVLNINVFLMPVEVPAYNGALDTMLLSFKETMPILHWIVLALLLFVGAVLLNRMVIINRLSNTITLYPGLFFIVILSAFPLFSNVTSILISLILLLLLLSNLMYINSRTGVAPKIFNVGLYLGLMSVLFLPHLAYVFMIVVAINLLSTLNQRIILNLLNGTMLPFYIIGLAVLFFGLTSESITSVYAVHFGFENFSLPSRLDEWLLIAVMTLFLIVIVITYNSVISKKSTQSIRKISIFTLSMLFAGLIHFMSGIGSLHNLMLLVPVVAFYVAEGVLRFKKDSNGELILILLVILGIMMPFVV